MTAAQPSERLVSLAWLLEGIAADVPAKLRIADISQDSRAVREGGLFFALHGRRHHGLEHVAEAEARGASVVLWEPAPGVDAPRLSGSTFVLPVPQLSAAVGRMADRFFGAPSAQLRVCGVTGTNGKTTCAYLLAQSLQLLEGPCAYIGTLGWGRIGGLEELAHTTPDAISMQRMLAALAAAGVREVAIEVSSHALDQHRVEGIRFHTAAFTNLTRDHLDYHGTMQAYGAAKARLFEFAGVRRFVVNTADEFGAMLARRIGVDERLTAVWVGERSAAAAGVRHLCAVRVVPQPRGLEIGFDGSFGALALRSSLIGRFNAENLTVVLGCLLSLGIAPDRAVAALGACAAAPGRMEIVGPAAGGKPLAVVDYAHTPDALDKALRALREHCAGALWCVFGCGGDRDPGKRPIMGAIADELADEIIVTDDNPRTENPAAITAAISAAIKRRPARVIADRGQAIATALTEARGVDVVLIAGKGHEEYQIYGQTRRTFSDRHEALRHLREAA